MSRGPLTIEQILTALADTPARIAELTTGLSTAQLHASPGPGEWSANDVLAHLRSCADVWGDCIMTIINQDTPAIRAMDPRSWIKRTNYQGMEFQPSLQAYTAQRTALLVLLESLSPGDWSRSATVTGAGKPLVRTVQGYAQWLARHERPHLKQIDRIVGTMRMVPDRGPTIPQGIQ